MRYERHGRKEQAHTSEKPKSGVRNSTEVKTSEKPKSGESEIPKCRLLKNRSQEVGKTEANNTEHNNIKYNYTESNENESIFSYLHVPQSAQRGFSQNVEDRLMYRERICKNISFDNLMEQYDKSVVSGIVDLMVDSVCSNREYIVINSEQIPQKIVMSVFLRLNSTHIEYVLECLKNNTSKVKNIKSYLLTMLYNSCSTMGAYYTAEVNHDLYGGVEK